MDLTDGLSGADIGKIIKGFAEEAARLERLSRYYANSGAILSRSMDSGKPDNKLAHNFCKYITNMATGYFMGGGVRINIADGAFKEAFDEIVDYEYTRDLTFEIAKEFSKCGVSYELLYINEEGKLKSKMFPALSFIPIYSDKADEFLEGAVRVWAGKDILSGKITEYAELYTKKEIFSFQKTSADYTLTERRAHNFSDVPVIIYRNNEERKGDFEDVTALCDAYDKAQSDTANDFEYFTDAYLVIVGAGGGIAGEDGDGDGNDNKVKILKNERILLLDEKGQADWLIKNINDTAVENYKKRLFNDIFFLSQVPALSDESFGANLSGVAIKYKLLGLEQLTAVKENKFRSAVNKKMKFIAEYIKLTTGREFDPKEIEITFERNAMDNLSETVDNAKKLTGITSRETILNLLPFVDNAAAEMERIAKEDAGFEV